MKYLLLINAESADAASDCTPEDWMVYDKEVKDAGIFVSGLPADGAGQALVPCLMLK